MPAARSSVRPLTDALNHVRCLLIVRVFAVIAQARADVWCAPAVFAGAGDHATNYMILEPNQIIMNIIGGQYVERWPEDEYRIILYTPAFTYQQRITALTFLYGNLRLTAGTLQDANLLACLLHRHPADFGSHAFSCICACAPTYFSGAIGFMHRCGACQLALMMRPSAFTRAGLGHGAPGTTLSIHRHVGSRVEFSPSPMLSLLSPFSRQAIAGALVL